VILGGLLVAFFWLVHFLYMKWNHEDDLGDLRREHEETRLKIYLRGQLAFDARLGMLELVPHWTPYPAEAIEESELAVSIQKPA